MKQFDAAIYCKYLRWLCYLFIANVVIALIGNVASNFVTSLASLAVLLLVIYTLYHLSPFHSGFQLALTLCIVGTVMALVSVVAALMLVALAPLLALLLAFSPIIFSIAQYWAMLDAVRDISRAHGLYALADRAQKLRPQVLMSCGLFVISIFLSALLSLFLFLALAGIIWMLVNTIQVFLLFYRCSNQEYILVVDDNTLPNPEDPFS